MGLKQMLGRSVPLTCGQPVPLQCPALTVPPATRLPSPLGKPLPVSRELLFIPASCNDAGLLDWGRPSVLRAYWGLLEWCSRETHLTRGFSVLLWGAISA